MKLLKELMAITAATTLNEEQSKKKSGKRTAAGVYHRDYLKTKNKDYRQYDADEPTSKGE